MRDIALRALDTARTRGAAYADVRVVHFQSQSVTVRNRNVEGLVVDESLGFGVRVLVDGYWGFAASNDLNLPQAARGAAAAVKIPRASALVAGRRADIGPPVRTLGRYTTPIQKDPFAVSLEDRIDLLLGVTETLGRVPGIVLAAASGC